MARVRKLILTIASGSVLYSGMAPALGLGEITINSALNQPLEAEIELLEVGDLTESEMRIALASPEAFMRAGVDRTSFLDDLRFTTLLRGNKSVIRVVSRRPVQEPYLNFVVEMARPSGRLLREYTLLIDPPGSLADRPQAAGFQRSVEAVQPRMQLPVVNTPPPAVQGNTYTVVSGDSLWMIARRLQSAGSQVALPLLMADIHSLNPQAFVGGDVDRLISGATLLLPDSANPLAGSAVESAVAAQAQPPSVPQEPNPVPVPVSSEVAIVQQQLDEVLAAQQLQQQQLQLQMNDLQNQLSSLRLEVATKDQQVEALQSQLAQQPQAVPQDAVVAVVETAPQPVVVVQEQPNWFSGWLAGLVGGGLLAAILGGFIWLRRRDSSLPEPERVLADYMREMPAPEPAPVTTKRVLPVEPVDVAEVSHASKVAPVKSRTPAVAVEPDALDGANIYVAYGRLDEAREVLERSLLNDPARGDIRMRLLELLARMGDRAAFAMHAQYVQEHNGDVEQLERIKASHPGLFEGTADSAVLHNAVLNLGDEALPAANNAMLDVPMNLDNLALDADWGLLSPFDQPQPEKLGKGKADDVISGKLELPDVMDFPSDPQAFSPFANFQIKSNPDELLGKASLEPDAQPISGRSLDHLAGNPQSISRLNMALAYIDQGDLQSACNILNQLISEGDDKQKKQAREILARIA